MSRGQTWAGLVWVPANSSVLLQPAPNEGVELTTILTYGDGSTAYGWGGLYTDTAGTGALFFWRGSGIGEGDLSEQCNIDLNVFIDEDVQCEILNADATSRYIGFTGITMTADRIRSDVLPTSAATWVSIQPPVGEDWLITTLASWSDNGSGGEAQMYDGTNDVNRLVMARQLRRRAQGGGA